MKTEAWWHCSSWWKKLRWSGSISFVSRCIHFVFFPHTHFAALSQTAYQKLDTPVTNWAAIKGRKRKALLSAADWDPRLTSYLKDVSLCVCVCVWGTANSRQPELTQPPHPPRPPHTHTPGVPTAYISVSAQQTKPNKCCCSPSSDTRSYIEQRMQPSYKTVTFLIGIKISPLLIMCSCEKSYLKGLCVTQIHITEPRPVS